MLNRLKRRHPLNRISLFLLKLSQHSSSLSLHSSPGTTRQPVNEKYPKWSQYFTQKQYNTIFLACDSAASSANQSISHPPLSKLVLLLSRMIFTYFDFDIVFQPITNIPPIFNTHNIGMVCSITAYMLYIERPRAWDDAECTFITPGRTMYINGARQICT